MKSPVIPKEEITFRDDINATLMHVPAMRAHFEGGNLLMENFYSIQFIVACIYTS